MNDIWKFLAWIKKTKILGIYKKGGSRSSPCWTTTTNNNNNNEFACTIYHEDAKKSYLYFVIIQEKQFRAQTCFVVLFVLFFLTVTLSWVWWGRCEKTISRRRKEGWRKKTPGPGLEPGTCRVLGEGRQLHAMGLFRRESLSVPIDRVGRLRNTTCCVFWSFCTILYDFIVLGFFLNTLHLKKTE